MSKGNWSELYRRQQEGARRRNEVRHRSRQLMKELREVEIALIFAARELAEGRPAPFSRPELSTLQHRRHELKDRLGHGLPEFVVDHADQL